MRSRRFRSNFDDINSAGRRNYGTCQKCGHNHQPLKMFQGNLLCINCYDTNTKVIAPGLKKRVFELRENDEWREILAWTNRPASAWPD